MTLDQKNMKQALILAGGKGTRLRSITQGGQKVIVNVAGKTFIEHILERLMSEDFHIIYLAVGYRSDDVKDLINRLSLNHIVKTIDEDTPLGTGGALVNALATVRTEKLIVLNGDSYNDINYSQFLLDHEKFGADVSILTKFVSNISRYGEIKTQKTNKIYKFVEKTGENRAGVINVGVYAIKAGIFNKKIPKIFSLEDFLAQNVNKLNMISVPAEGEFIDIGTPEDFEYFKSIRRATP
jgi:D-glycero-alpha-D-manno-heptose 1-phosphate guanylyltransferase